MSKTVELNERATKAETETESLKQELARVEAEKEATLVQYNQCLETISKLEERIKEAEENARRIKEHADIAEKEIEALELQVTKLNEEKEDAALHYQQCMEIISSLEYKLSCAEEEVHRLNSKIVDEVEKLQSSEQKCLLLETSNHTLQSELQSLAQKVGSQSEELNEKQQELGRLWGCIQEERLLEKNTVLENSLSDLNAELDSIRGKVNVLEETCQSLLVEKSNLAAEKATLFSQLQSTTEKLEKLSEKSNLLENSLFDVNAELEGLRVKSKLNITHQTLKDLEKLHSELELKHLELKGEREPALQKVEELLVSLYSEREENSKVLKLNEDELAEKELQILILQEDANCKKKEYEEEVDRAIHAQLEIFILQKCIDDLEKKNLSLLVECQRLLEASKMSDKMISKLETENVQKHVDVNSLSEKIKILRIGLIQVLKTLDNNSGHFGEDMLEEDQMLLNHIYGKLQERQKSFDTIFNGNQQMAIENSILIAFLEKLKLKVENLVRKIAGNVNDIDMQIS
ncbi:hypothetical protein JHK87_012504 [Glycine soja]|nr:hypothetical protein JHK87_012504 [Glycine soja]